MKKVIRLILDCDGVLSDFVAGVRVLYRDITGKEVPEEILQHWHFTSKLSFKDAEEKAMFEHGLRQPGFCGSLPVFPEAQEGVKKLLEYGLDIHVVTSPLSGSATWMSERETWLAMHFGFSNRNVHHSQSKYLYQANLFVDDKPDHVRSWADHNEAGAAFLWDTPGNRDITDLARLRSWEELIARVASRRVRR